MNPMIAFLLAGATPAVNPASGPLAAATTAADRGEVRAGPVLAHTFLLTHRGEGTLRVTGVEGGCGCIRAAVSKADLRPGESADLTVEVNTLTQPDGPNAWRVTVRYQAEPPPAPPAAAGGLPPPRVAESFAAEFRLTAKLVREVSVTPPAVAISTTGAAAHTLTVADRRARPLTVTRAVSSAPFLGVAVRPAEVRADGRAQPVELTLSADAPAGHREETVTLYTDDPAYPELRVPVRVSKRAAGAVVVAPEAVALRFASGQAEASAVVVLRSPGGGAVRVAKADCDAPAVRLKWSLGAGPVATVRATAAGPGSGQAEIRVLLAEPAGHTITVPVTWSAD